MSKSNLLQALVNFINYMQKHFSDVLQIPLMPERPIWGIITKALDLEDENIECSKNMFQDPLNGTSFCQKYSL